MNRLKRNGVFLGTVLVFSFLLVACSSSEDENEAEKDAIRSNQF